MTPIAFITRSDTPVFFIVTVLEGDVFPIFIVANFTAIGDAETLGGGASPDRFTLTISFFGSFEEMLMVALFLPKGDVGVNVTDTWHEEFAGIGLGQPFAGLDPNSEAFVPESVIEFITRSDLPVFFIVSILGVDTPPVFTSPRLIDVGLTEIFGGVAAVDSKGNKIIKLIVQIEINSLDSAFI
ncbi:MAG: hypothetical protein WB554_14160 [Desulfomonilaceae bacterium]